MKFFACYFLCFLIFNTLTAREFPVKNTEKKPVPKAAMYGCAVPNARTDLDINNVRAQIFSSSDMWWDLLPNGSPKYEVPKNSGKSSLFAGSIWVGGLDASGNLKIAAQMLRQNREIDFWSGPLDTRYVSILPEDCQKYDRHWKITKAEVEAFINDSTASEAIKNYPGNGDVTKGQANYLAPFYDNNVDGIYNYKDGDYPNYYLSGSSDKCENLLLGDQTIWWVFNDKGNIHTAGTPSNPIGLEIQAQAFAFNDTGHIGNTTFYKYKIINRSNTRIDSTYFGFWTDPDIGNFLDDYVGCDVNRNLGFCYNGDDDDEGPQGYGLNPPAVGIDFFQGPLADNNDGIDNDRDGTIDEIGEGILMSRFIYFNNDVSVRGNPSKGLDYYNYMRGRWIDGTKMTYGGNGKGMGTGATTIPCNFMVPGNSDTAFTSPWTDLTGGNFSADRKFVISAGHFTLQPGAVNYITIAAVWARDTSSSDRSLGKLMEADDVAQTLFNNCFNAQASAPKPKQFYSAELEVYPVPFKTSTLIKFSNPKFENHELEIFDVSGKRVRYYKDITTDKFEIERGNLKNGIYFLRLSNKIAYTFLCKKIIVE